MNHDRTLMRVSGADKEALLQGIITQDIALLETAPILFSAMLSPQGKWLHDFFIFAHEGDIYIDHHAAISTALLKRLTLYKLRAQVTLSLAEGWHFSMEQACPDTPPTDCIALPDPRHHALPWRVWSRSPRDGTCTPEDYLRIRMAHGIPEGGIDVTEKETALDVGYDLLHGVSFSKGCYVGQEVTARMHYKAVLRKGFFIVAADDALLLPGGPHPITYDGKTIGELRSHDGQKGLAFGRFDAILGAMESGGGDTARWPRGPACDTACLASPENRCI
jgi:folate-binding protein YgfZ